MAAAQAAPRRIVSLNMCADQLLIALADKDQIAALSPYARDPELSFYARRAAAYPATSGKTEAVLKLHPDLIVAPPYGQQALLARFSPPGTAVVDVPPAESVEAIYANIGAVARAVGHPERGKAMIARMKRELAAVARDRPGHGRIAAYYQRRGYLTGTGTLWDGIMAQAGLVNLAARLNRPSLSRLPLEEIIKARPDFLFMDSSTATVSDRGSEMLHHPALAKAVPPNRRFYIGQALTVCGGPFYTIAVKRVSDLIFWADRAATLPD